VVEPFETLGHDLVRQNHVGARKVSKAQALWPMRGRRFKRSF
jgi:hypothetical protein